MKDADKEVAIAVAHHPGKEKYLAVKRSEEKEVKPGIWEFSSGEIKEDETPREAVVRELREETGLKGDLKSEGEVHRREIAGKTLRFHPFLLEVDSDDIELSWEHSDYRWIERGDIKDMEVQENFERVLESVT